eukprot:2567616-Pleurochrysis_carterae.AAC.2
MSSRTANRKTVCCQVKSVKTNTSWHWPLLVAIIQSGHSDADNVPAILSHSRTKSRDKEHKKWVGTAMSATGALVAGRQLSGDTRRHTLLIFN